MPYAEDRRRVAEDQRRHFMRANLQFEWPDVDLESPFVYLRVILTPKITPEVAVSK
jgi:hypothetical protein